MRQGGRPTQPGGLGTGPTALLGHYRGRLIIVILLRECHYQFLDSAGIEPTTSYVAAGHPITAPTMHSNHTTKLIQGHNNK